MLHHNNTAALDGPAEELLTIREVAKRLRVDNSTVRRWISSGALEAIVLPHQGRRQIYRVKSTVLAAIVEGANPPAYTPPIYPTGQGPRPPRGGWEPRKQYDRPD